MVAKDKVMDLFYDKSSILGVGERFRVLTFEEEDTSAVVVRDDLRGSLLDISEVRITG